MVAEGDTREAMADQVCPLTDIRLASTAAEALDEAPAFNALLIRLTRFPYSGVDRMKPLTWSAVRVEGRGPISSRDSATAVESAVRLLLFDVASEAKTILPSELVAISIDSCVDEDAGIDGGACSVPAPRGESNCVMEADAAAGTALSIVTAAFADVTVAGEDEEPPPQDAVITAQRITIAVRISIRKCVMNPPRHPADLRVTARAFAT